MEKNTSIIKIDRRLLFVIRHLLPSKQNKKNLHLRKIIKNIYYRNYCQVQGMMFLKSNPSGMNEWIANTCIKIEFCLWIFMLPSSQFWLDLIHNINFIIYYPFIWCKIKGKKWEAILSTFIFLHLQLLQSPQEGGVKYNTEFTLVAHCLCVYDSDYVNVKILVI